MNTYSFSLAGSPTANIGKSVAYKGDTLIAVLSSINMARPKDVFCWLSLKDGSVLAHGTFVSSYIKSVTSFWFSQSLILDEDSNNIFASGYISILLMYFFRNMIASSNP